MSVRRAAPVRRADVILSVSPLTGVPSVSTAPQGTISLSAALALVPPARGVSIVVNASVVPPIRIGPVYPGELGLQ
jgi:hypothetical protein